MQNQPGEISQPETTENQDFEALVRGSFLRNVPELVASGLSMEAAIKTAYEKDFLLLIDLQVTAERMSSGGYRAYTEKDKAHHALIERMCLKVWAGFNQAN